MHMLRSLLVILWISLSLNSFSQSFTNNLVIKPGKPENAGVSGERLKKMDSYLQSNVDSGFVNGISALIIRNGVIVYNKSFGYNDDSRKVKMQPDNIFRIASQTKAITSVAVLMLYEEGKFLLDDNISKYIPEFKNPVVLSEFNASDTTYKTVPASREITIRDLLTHTSGIGYAQIGSREADAIYAKAGVTSGIGVGKIVLANGMKNLAKCPLFHNPGEKFTYGLNTDLLGYLVEVVSGMSLKDFFQTRIFNHLGMKDTYFFLPDPKKDRLVSLYTEDTVTHKAVLMKPTIMIEEPFIRDYPLTDGTYYSGGGGLSSTMMDYAIFLQMLMNGGQYNGVRILGRNTVRMMVTNQVNSIGKQFGLGFGLTTEDNKGKLPVQEGSFEWGGMFATGYWADPKEKLIGLIYRNIWPTSHGNNDTFKVLTYSAIND
jgi:CubicO group peptidase (beta-lactamase class C family)